MKQIAGAAALAAALFLCLGFGSRAPHASADPDPQGTICTPYTSAYACTVAPATPPPRKMATPTPTVVPISTPAPVKPTNDLVLAIIEWIKSQPSGTPIRPVLQYFGLEWMDTPLLEGWTLHFRETLSYVDEYGKVQPAWGLTCPVPTFGGCSGAPTRSILISLDKTSSDADPLLLGALAWKTGLTNIGKASPLDIIATIGHEIGHAVYIGADEEAARRIGACAVDPMCPKVLPPAKEEDILNGVP